MLLIERLFTHFLIFRLECNCIYAILKEKRTLLQKRRHELHRLDIALKVNMNGYRNKTDILIASRVLDLSIT